jgi:flagellar protein FlbD
MNERGLILFGERADKEPEGFMIRLTRLNHAPLVLNSDLIEHIDVTPDTVITLTTGQILRVRETAEEVIERIVDFRRRIFLAPEEPSVTTQLPEELD